MLTGTSPFYDYVKDENTDQRTLFKRIIAGKWDFPEYCAISSEAKDLLRKMLVVDPKERLGCLARGDLDLREHPWFSQVDFCKLYLKEIAAPWVPDIRNPLDGSNFAKWDKLEDKTKTLSPLSDSEQKLFEKF